MRCPACSKELSHLDAGGGVALDVCQGGCGGVWFDNFELQKFDEAHEMADSAVFDVKPADGARPAAAAPAEEGGAVGRANVASTGPKRACPRCEGMKLRKYFYNAARDIEVEQCASCGGHWLDHGELEKIRRANAGKQASEFDKASAEDKLLRATRSLEGRR